MPVKRKPWKTIADLKTKNGLPHVMFAKRKDGTYATIRGGLLSNTFIGRVHFKDGKRKRVAIRVFSVKITDTEAANHQKVIDELKNAGVKMPKMAMLQISVPQLEDIEWVLVSELFGSTLGGSKIDNLSSKDEYKSLNLFQKISIIKEYTKIGNAGYKPLRYTVMPFKDPKKGAILINPDLLTLKIKNGRPNLHEIAHELYVEISELSNNNKEFEQLYDEALRNANPQLKRSIIKLTSYF